VPIIIDRHSLRVVGSQFGVDPCLKRFPVHSNHCCFSRGLMVRDARRRAPHHEGRTAASCGAAHGM